MNATIDIARYEEIKTQMLKGKAKQDQSVYFKQYRIDNLEKLKQSANEYYKNNKEKFLIKVDCPICGKNMNKTNLKRHQKASLCIKSVLKKEFLQKKAHDLEQGLEAVEPKL